MFWPVSEIFLYKILIIEAHFAHLMKYLSIVCEYWYFSPIHWCDEVDFVKLR